MGPNTIHILHEAKSPQEYAPVIRVAVERGWCRDAAFAVLGGFIVIGVIVVLEGWR
jgi:hypothetical protein